MENISCLDQDMISKERQTLASLLIWTTRMHYSTNSCQSSEGCQKSCWAWGLHQAHSIQIHPEGTLCSSKDDWTNICRRRSYPLTQKDSYDNPWLSLSRVERYCNFNTFGYSLTHLQTQTVICVGAHLFSPEQKVKMSIFNTIYYYS